jgi:hypothetical protein
LNRRNIVVNELGVWLHGVTVTGHTIKKAP